MQFENRQVAEGVNVTKVHPLKQFMQLLIATVILVVMVIIVLRLSGAWLAKRIPFSFEVQVMDTLDIDFGDAAPDSDMRQYLNALGKKLEVAMELPDGMTTNIHYSTDAVFNAFATVGGNLMFYRGLLEELPHENALAMVLAHEIAHVQHRDPIAGLGGGVVSSVALIALAGQSGTGPAGKVLNNAGVLTSIQFTRRMEQEADTAAIAAVNRIYGHVNGADMLFHVLQRKGASRQDIPDTIRRFTETHPALEDRIDAIAARVSAEGWEDSGELTPLPENFKQWLQGN